jgi:hypothetical protein
MVEGRGNFLLSPMVARRGSLRQITGSLRDGETEVMLRIEMRHRQRSETTFFCGNDPPLAVFYSLLPIALPERGAGYSGPAIGMRVDC